jgi:Ca2+-binding RTX toxin-like protein
MTKPNDQNPSQRPQDENPQNDPAETGRPEQNPNPDKSKKRPRGQVESLEQRILLSATWVDADTGDMLDGPTDGDDVYDGSDGIDTAHGFAGNDLLFGGDGNDALYGGDGNDALFGGDGQDQLFGEAGADTLDGGDGSDFLHGGDGDDTLIASGGDDALYGGFGDDTFDFAQAQDGDEYTVSGGDGEHDTIDLSMYRTDQVQHGDGRIDVAMDEGGTFTIHHAGVERVRIGDEMFDLDGPDEPDDVNSESVIDSIDLPDDAVLPDAGAESWIPEAVDEYVLGAEDTSLTTQNVLATDVDHDGDSLAVDSFTQPDHGTVNYNDDGTFEYTPDENFNGVDTFTYRVADGDGHYATGSVEVHVQAVDDAPQADAGADLVVDDGDTVQLQGSASDVEGQDLSYEWVQTGGPHVQLDDPASPTPTFTAPEGVSNSEVSFELHVSDGTNTSVDTVDITVNANDGAPTAAAGRPQVANEGDTIQLNGQATDPEGEGLTVQWRQLSGPPVELSDPSSLNPTFDTPDVPMGETDIEFELIVSDGTNTSVDTVGVTVIGEQWSVDAGADQVVDEGATVTLQATGSQDADASDDLTYTWRQVSGPPVELDDPHAAQPSFTAPDVDDTTPIRFEVEVSDGEDMHVDQVDVVVHDPDTDWVHSLNPSQFRQLDADQVHHLTADQIASIDNRYDFYNMSQDARHALNAEQVQALDTSEISIGYLSGEQREMLTADQIGDLSTSNLRYVPADQVEHITAEQLGSIDNRYDFYNMSEDARHELDAEQVQALDTSEISIGYLSGEQREMLTADQIGDLSTSNLRYVPADQVEHITAEQLGSIDNRYDFYNMSEDARHELNAEQVQALDTSEISIGYISGDQREMLTADQIGDLSTSNLRYVPASQVEHITVDQIGSIDNRYDFYNMSQDARHELDAEQVQALDTSEISIGYISGEQREMLTADQIGDLPTSNLRYVPASQVEHITVDQIGSISNRYDFYNMSEDARHELDAEQVQALDTSEVSIGYISGEQREMLTADQISDLPTSNLRYVPASQVEHITVDQIASIDNQYDFYNMSQDARHELDAEQVQALDTSQISIGYLSGEQRELLTADQIGDLPTSNLRYVPASQVEHITVDQIASIDNRYDFYNMSQDARHELDAEQVQALDTSQISIGYLSNAQREHLTVDQLQALPSSQLRYVPPSRVPDLAPEQFASITNRYDFYNMSSDQQGAMTHEQIRAISPNVQNVTIVGTDDADTLAGGGGVNNIVGNAGDDTLTGGGGKDVLDGGAGSDVLDGGDGSDLLIGGGGNDVLRGGGGADWMRFEQPNDGDVYTVDGGDQNDTIDLSNYDPDRITMTNGRIVVGLEDGGSFTIEHSNIETVQLGEGPVAAIYNTPPQADAGGDQLVTEHDEVHLTALGSQDADNDDLTYTWRQVEGPTVTLRDADSADATFNPPAVREPTALTFEVTVSDGKVMDTDMITVTVEPVNDAPVVDAGEHITVEEGATVQLRGTASDVDSDNLTYEWVQTRGPKVQLDDPTSATPTFTAPEGLSNSEIEFELRVGDGENVQTDTVGITLHADDDAPMAAAGGPQVVNEGDTIQLNGQATDPEGQDLTVQWRQVSGPPVELSDPNALNPTFDTPNVPMGETDIEFELIVSDGTNTSVDTVAVTVVGEEWSVEAGDDLVVTEGDTVTLNGHVPGDALNFDADEIDSYGGSNQDQGVDVSVEDGGTTLHMVGNGWKSIDMPYTITEDTVIEFDFRSTAEGEIHGIGFDTDAGIDSNRTFKLHGTQDWGRGDYDDYDSNGEWKHYRIPVGEHFQGDFDRLVFVNDHDVSNPTAESMFANIRVYEAGSEPTDSEVSYEWAQTGGPQVELSDPHAAQPTFTAPDGLNDAELTFELRASDGSDTVTDTVTVSVVGREWSVDAGDDLVVSEGDTVSLSASVPRESLNFDADEIDSYGGANQDRGVDVTVEDGGTTLHMVGNGWKSIDLPYTVTEDTILEFDFRSTAEGEIHGIGFDTDAGIDSDRTFKLHGTQNWGRGDYDNYDSDGEWKHYRITVGEHFQGDFDRLVFVNDHDVSNPTAESMFANVRVFEAGSEPAGDDVSYEWVQTGGPQVELSDPHAAEPTFTAPEGVTNTELTFELRASDGSDTVTDTVSVTVNADDDAPTAEAGDPQVVDEGAVVQLRGQGTDPEGQDLTYEWVQTAGPQVQLDDPTSPTPTFTAPEGVQNEDISFELRVSDGTSTSVDTVNVTILADNDLPTVDAGADGAVTAGESFQLVGTSSDPDSQSVTYRWVQTGGPDVTLDDPTANSPTFTAPDVADGTTLTFRLEASDGENMVYDTVNVTVNPAAVTPTEPVAPDPVPAPVTPTTPEPAPQDVTPPADVTPPRDVTPPADDATPVPVTPVTPAVPESPTPRAVEPQPATPAAATETPSQPSGTRGDAVTDQSSADESSPNAAQPVGSVVPTADVADTPAAEGADWDGSEQLEVLDPQAEFAAHLETPQDVTPETVAPEAVPSDGRVEIDGTRFEPESDEITLTPPQAERPPLEMPDGLDQQGFDTVFQVDGDLPSPGESAATESPMARGPGDVIGDGDTPATRLAPHEHRVEADSEEDAQPTGDKPDSLWAALWGLLRGRGGQRSDEVTTGRDNERGRRT